MISSRRSKRFYTAWAKSGRSSLYADFAHWQRRQLDPAALQPQLDFWLAHLDKDRLLLQLPGRLRSLLSQTPQAVSRSALKAGTQVYALLEQPILDPQASFFEQGGTSLQAVILCVQLQGLWGTAVPPQLVFLHPQLADLVRVLKPYAGKRAY